MLNYRLQFAEGIIKGKTKQSKKVPINRVKGDELQTATETHLEILTEYNTVKNDLTLKLIASLSAQLETVQHDMEKARKLSKEDIKGEKLDENLEALNHHLQDAKGIIYKAIEIQKKVPKNLVIELEAKLKSAIDNYSEISNE